VWIAPFSHKRGLHQLDHLNLFWPIACGDLFQSSHAQRPGHRRTIVHHYLHRCGHLLWCAELLADHMRHCSVAARLPHWLADPANFGYMYGHTLGQYMHVQLPNGIPTGIVDFIVCRAAKRGKLHDIVECSEYVQPETVRHTRPTNQQRDSHRNHVQSRVVGARPTVHIRMPLRLCWPGRALVKDAHVL
jgi:hypothetical protein